LDVTFITSLQSSEYSNRSVLKTLGPCRTVSNC